MDNTEIKKVFCGICSPCCPIDAYVKEGKICIRFEGSYGGLCAKGAASKQYVYNKERILYPMKRIGEKGSRKFERITWEEDF